MGSYRGLDKYFFTTIDEHAMKDECLLWPYSCHPDGYGQVTFEGKQRKTHRLALEHKLGREIGEGLHALHTHTGNRNCYAMAHLKEGTNADNMVDRVLDGTSNKGTVYRERGAVNRSRKLRLKRCD